MERREKNDKKSPLDHFIISKNLNVKKLDVVTDDDGRIEQLAQKVYDHKEDKDKYDIIYGEPDHRKVVLEIEE